MQSKKISAPRHSSHNILKTILLIIVLIWRSFSFLCLKEKDFPETRSWWAAVCIEHYSVLNGHGPAEPLGMLWNWEAPTGSTARQIPFWKQLGYYPKRDSSTFRALEDSASSTGVFSLPYSSMEINSVTLNMTKLSWWDAFSASFNAHREKFC